MLYDTNKMKRERQKLIDEMRKITDAAQTREDRKMTAEEAKKWSEYEAQVTAATDEIKRCERQNELEMSSEGSTPAGEQTPKSAKDEKRFNSLGEFLGAVYNATRGTVDSRLIESRSPTGMGEIKPSDGGFAVQTDLLGELVKRTYEKSLIASRCRKIPIGAKSNALEYLGIDETSRVTGSRMGGVRAYWAAEAATVTATNPKFRKSRMSLEKLMAFIYMTDELLQDTTAMDALASEVIGDELAWMVDDAVLNGTGSGKPLGIMQSPALVSIAKETNQTAGTIVYENLLKMWTRMWAPSRANSVWFINQDCEQQLMTMAFVIGVSGVPVYMPAGGATAAPYSTIFGRPVIPVEQTKTIGTTGDIILSDYSQYMLIDKGNIDGESSIHVRFLYDEQVFRFVYRCNGQPIWNAALTPATGSVNTLSPYIALATRS